jgi:hypothetical protein
VNPGKQVQSITLPNNSDVVLLAINLTLPSFHLLTSAQDTSAG